VIIITTNNFDAALNRQQCHKIIDQLNDVQLADAVDYLAELVDLYEEEKHLNQLNEIYKTKK
jgi:hypothetical protein